MIFTESLWHEEAQLYIHGDVVVPQEVIGHCQLITRQAHHFRETPHYAIQQPRIAFGHDDRHTA